MDDLKLVQALLKKYPVLKELPELADLSFFSPGARHIVPAILEANRGDKNTARLAVRLCRAITLYEEGLHDKKRPLYAGLLYGEAGAPLREIVTALGESFIGTPVNGLPSVTLIDCATFPPGQHPAALYQLTGPMDRENTQLPLLWPIAYESADLWARAGHELFPLHRFIKSFEEFREAIGSDIHARLDGHPQLHDFELFADQLFQSVSEKIGRVSTDIWSRYAPIRSIIVFDGVENASPELLARIRSILHGGLTVFVNGPMQADFRNSIVLLTSYDPMLVSKGQKIGFADGSPSDSSARYSGVRKLLLRDEQYRDIVRDLGDQILLIRPRSLDSQEYRINTMLKHLTSTYRKIGIEVIFRSPFKAWLLTQSRDVDQKPEFPDYKLEDMVDRYIKLPLAQKIASGQLRVSDAAIFLIQKGAESPDVKIEHRETAPATEVLTRAKVVDGLRKSPLDFPDTPAVVKLYEYLQEIGVSILLQKQRLTTQGKAPKPHDTP